MENYEKPQENNTVIEIVLSSDDWESIFKHAKQLTPNKKYIVGMESSYYCESIEDPSGDCGVYVAPYLINKYVKNNNKYMLIDIKPKKYTKDIDYKDWEPAVFNESGSKFMFITGEVIDVRGDNSLLVLDGKANVLVERDVSSIFKESLVDTDYYALSGMINNHGNVEFSNLVDLIGRRGVWFTMGFNGNVVEKEKSIFYKKNSIN